MPARDSDASLDAISNLIHILLAVAYYSFAGDVLKASILDGSSEIRKKFPETWLWEAIERF